MEGCKISRQLERLAAQVDRSLTDIMVSEYLPWNFRSYSSRTSELGRNPNFEEMMPIIRRNRIGLNLLYAVEIASILGAIYYWT